MNETPLEVAVRWEHKNIIEALFKNGISDNVIKRALKHA